MIMKISEIKRLRESLEASHIVVFTIGKDRQQSVSTHGKTFANAKEAAEMGNSLKRLLGWPSELCKAQPLDRVCENCHFYKYPDRSDLTYGIEGKCCVEPKKVERRRDSVACRFFEPRL